MSSEDNTPPEIPAQPGTVNLTATNVLGLANSILSLVGVANPALAGAAVAVKGAMALVNDMLVPQIKLLVKSGDITVADQAQVKAVYDHYRATFATSFDSPEWQVDP